MKRLVVTVALAAAVAVIGLPGRHICPQKSVCSRPAPMATIQLA
jgi:hypothetical protein